MMAGGRHPVSLPIEIEYARVVQPGGDDMRDLALGLITIVVTCRGTGEELARCDLRGAMPPGLHPVFGLSPPELSGTWSMGPRTAFRIDLARVAVGGVRLEIEHLLPAAPAWGPAIVSSGWNQARCIFQGGRALIDLGPTARSTPLADAVGGKRALVVLGMHRSGTSAMTRVLSLAGAALPANLMPNAADNPGGFWESVSISELNEAALNGVGSSWDDMFAPSWQQVLGQPGLGLLEAARQVLRVAYGGRELIVVKDPRISLMVPFWDHVLRAEGYTPNYVLMVRDPQDVAASLLRRNGFAAPKSLLLWASYMVAAERDTRGMQRCFVRFGDLLQSPEATLSGLAEAMGDAGLDLAPPAWAEIARFLGPPQPPSANMGRMGPFSRLTPFYDALGCRPLDDRWLQEEALRVGQWLTELSDTVGPIIREARVKRLMPGPSA